MVYLAQLLVVITDQLKIVRIRARNMPCVHGHKRFDDDSSLTLHQESDGVACSMRRPVETQKLSLDNVRMSGSGL